MKLFRLHEGKTTVIPESSYRAHEVGGFGETTLQTFIADHPDLIPSDQIDRDDPPRFVLVKREAGVTAGSVDILLLDHKAVPTLVETKLIDNPEIRRTVIGQSIEYLSHLRREWNAEKIIEEGRRYWTARRKSFDAAAEEVNTPLGADFVRTLDANIKSGHMRLIVAADRLPGELRTSLEFLNEFSTFDVYGLEVKLFAAEGPSDIVLAPQLIGVKEKDIKRDGWTKERFFAALDAAGASPEDAELVEDMRQFGIEISERDVEWGSGVERGSFTARLVVGRERFSLFSFYTTKEFSVNVGWNHKRLDQIDAEISERYRARVKTDLGVSLDKNKWENGWPIAKLSTLTSDNAGAFKALIRDFVVEVKRLLKPEATMQP